MTWIQSTLPLSTQTTQLTQQSVTFDGNVTAGNCLLAYITYSTVPGATISSVTDNKGNAWSLVQLVNDTLLTQASALYSTFGSVAGPTTVTVQFTGAGATYIGMVAAEYTNASSVDVFAGRTNMSDNGGAGTTATTNGFNTGAMTTTAAGEQIVAFFTNDNDPDETTAGTTNAFIRRESSMIAGSSIYTSSNYPSIMMEDYIQPSAGSITPTATDAAGTGKYYSAIAVALKTGTDTTPAINGLVSTYPGDYSTTTATKTLTVTTSPGDYLVVYGGGATNAATLGTPSGNSVSFALQSSVVTASRATAYIWVGRDSNGGSGWTLSCTAAGGQNWGFSCLVFRDIAGIGTTASSNAAAGAGVYPALSLTTTVGGSSLVVFETDSLHIQSSIDGYIHHWKAINGISPTFGNDREIDLGPARLIPTTFSMNGVIYDNVGPANTTLTPAMTMPDGQQYSMVALEVLQPVSGVSAPWLLDSREFFEDFDTYTNGTTVTTASDPTKFSSIQSATSGTGVIDTAHAESSPNALKITGTASTGNQFYGQYTFATTTDHTYVRAAFYITAYPSTSTLLYGITTVNDLTNIDQANVVISASGKIQIYDGGALTSFVDLKNTAMPLNQWFFLEYHLDWPNGQETVQVYDNSGMLIDTISTGNGIYGGVRPNAVKIGVLNAPGTGAPGATYTYWVDSVAVSKIGWMGGA